MRRLLLAVATALLALLATAPSAAAGGWAVTSIDAFDAPTPGESVAVTFTILQHGQTPVDLEDGTVSIEVVAGSGTVERFVATSLATTGRYTSSVTFPAGTSTWRVHQGGFGTQELGTVDVAGASSSAAASASDRPPSSPALLRYGLPAVVVALALFVAADVTGMRRRRTAVA